MGLQKGLILENYATLANVSAWLMIVYFWIACVAALVLSIMTIKNPDKLKKKKIGYVNKIIPLFTFAAVLYNSYVLISLEQVFLPVILTVSYGIALLWAYIAKSILKSALKEFNK